MIPTSRNFNGKSTVEAEGKTFYRSYEFVEIGKHRLKIKIISVNSPYRQGLAFSFSKDPKFKGSLDINGKRFVPEKRNLSYVLPVSFPDDVEFILDLNIENGSFYLSNASDYLDDYPELVEQISRQTGRSRDQFRGCSYTSGLSGYSSGNAFWIEALSEMCNRFYCNDHEMDDDFNDLIFDLEICQ